jgi:hypothetical protein
MPISTLPNDSPILSVKENDDVTRSTLEANPLTAALAVPLADFMIQTWQPTYLSALALDYALAVAHARELYADVVCNGLVYKLDGALLMLTNKDRSAPIYVQYFGAQRPFEVCAGILGPQLETMRSWISPLTSSSNATLQAIGGEIKVAVGDADAAVTAKAAAKSAILVFETTGERALMIAAYNALRKVTYGALGQIKHLHAELPNDFADTFFRHEGKRAVDKMSPDQLQAKADALEAQATALKQKRQAILDKQKADEEAKLELEKKQAALDAKLKDKQALDAEIKKMEDDLKK